MTKWVAYPQEVPNFESCDSFKDLQMLKIPAFDRSYIIVLDCQTIDRERVSIAMTIFLEEWREQFPFHTGAAEKTLHNVIVEFNNLDKSRNGYDITGSYVKNANVTGLAYTPGMAWVKTSEGERVCNTSFSHELVHMIIWNIMETDGDPDHEGKKYLGWSHKHSMLIDKVNQRLCTLGI